MTAIMKFVFVSGFVLVSTVVQSYIRVPNKKRQLLVLVFHLTDQISLLTSCTVKHMCWQLNIKRQRSRIIAIVILITRHNTTKNIIQKYGDAVISKCMIHR